MALLSPAQFAAKWTPLLANNVFQDIDGVRLQQLVTDISDSFAATTSGVNVPDWQEGTYYRLGFVILYSVTNTFYKAQEAGYLDSPSGPEAELQWEATLSPAGDNALYQVGTVAALRAARGRWVPGRLYVLNNRTDPDSGDALSDVYVRALSAGALEPNGFTLDNASLAAVPVPVSYDLATDETAPVVSGGPGDGYSKDEADTLLATKGSQQVQAQHTQQLATLAARAANLYAHYADNSVAPFADLDSYLAAASRNGGTFRLQNEALALQVTRSNKGGWPAFWDAAGSAITVADGETLTSAGAGLANLFFANFYLKGGPAGTAVFDLASSLPQTTQPGRASLLLNGQCLITLRNAANVVALDGGYYKKITGAGKYYLLGSVQVDDMTGASNVVDLRAGTGGGGGGTGDAYTKAETDQKDATLQHQIDDINAHGGPVLLKFVFEPGYADEYIFTAGPDVVGVYGTEGFSNISNATYYIGIAVTALPLTIQQGDKIRIAISRQNATQVASVTLSK